MNTSIHIVYYKGVKIICENGLYWMEEMPFRKYFNLSPVKSEIDKINKDLNENIQNLRELVNRKS